MILLNPKPLLPVFLFLTAMLCLGPESYAEGPSGITFIASAEELAGALENEKSIRGLAIRSEFYASSGKATRTKIDQLVRRSSNTLIPTIVYGKGPRPDILGAWFPKLRGFLNCGFDVAGVFPSFVLDDNVARQLTDDNWGFVGVYVLLCFTDISADSEAESRDRTNLYWDAERRDLKESGFATLN